MFSINRTVVPVDGKAEMQTHMEASENTSGLARGSTAWLALGLHLEEEQYVDVHSCHYCG